jgi:hypothetical protein
MSRRFGLFRRASDEDSVIPALTRLGCGLLRPHEPHLFETSVQRFSCPGLAAHVPAQADGRADADAAPDPTQATA